MKIVVIGGSGLIGSQVVADLTAQGHEAVAASPNTGVDTLTGEGLAEAFTGADVVIDVSNSPSFEDTAVLEFFRTSTRNQLDAEAAAGVGHHVVLSIVGADQLPGSGYLRAKIAQEKLVKESAIPYSIVRATQFLEFLAGIANNATQDDGVHLPSAYIQPVAASEVAATVADVAVGAPLDGVVEIGGPEKFRMDEVIRQVLADEADPRTVVTDDAAGYFGATLRDDSLTTGEGARLGTITLKEWSAR